MSAENRRTLAALDDDALEAALRDLSGAIAVAPPAAVAASVGARLREQDRGRQWRSNRRPVLRWALVAALLALLAFAALAAATGLGLPGLRILFGGPIAAPSLSPSASTLPGPTPLPSHAPASAPAAATPSAPASPARTIATDDLGTRTTLEAARAAVPFTLFVPDAAAVGGATAAVYLDSTVLQGQVALVFPATAGLPATRTSPIGPDGTAVVLAITESNGTFGTAYLEKVLGPGTTVTPVVVDGANGFWIAGQPHQLVVLDASGQPLFQTLRDIGDVLVFVRGGTLIRIESGLGLQLTLAIAHALR